MNRQTLYITWQKYCLDIELMLDTMWCPLNIFLSFYCPLNWVLHISRTYRSYLCTVESVCDKSQMKGLLSIDKLLFLHSRICSEGDESKIIVQSSQLNKQKLYGVAPLYIYRWQILDPPLKIGVNWTVHYVKCMNYIMHILAGCYSDKSTVRTQRFCTCHVF